MYPVYPESDTKFFYKVVDAQITFVPAADGKIDHLVLHQNNMDQKARKKEAGFTPTPPRTEISVSPEILASYVGTYQLAPSVRFDVTLVDGKLMVQLTGQPRYPVYPESESKFFYKVVDAQLTFVKGDDGKAKELILHQSGRNQTAKRVP
jgi:hypothetical protein